MNLESEQKLTQEDYGNAFSELSFLLDIYSETINDLMGGSIDSVGRITGREMAKKIPIYLTDLSPESVMQSVTEYLKHGFDISCSCQDHNVGIKIERCVIRKVCENRNLPLGGPLCRIFHSYLDG
ncbi:MAG: hypothetical protein OEM52_07515, partial [bacterium]|nr:hypothetical protein [bacterium]